MAASFQVIIGSEYDTEIKELICNLRNETKPLARLPPRKAIPIVIEVSKRSCKIMQEKNCIPTRSALRGDLWGARYVLSGFRKVPEFIHKFRIQVTSSEKPNAIVVHNRFPPWDIFESSIKGYVWQSVNSTNLDVMPSVLTYLLYKYRNNLIRYCAEGAIFIAHNNTWFYGAGLFETEQEEVIQRFSEIELLEREAVTAAIDFGALLAWPTLQIGSLLKALQDVANDPEVKKSDDWRRESGFTPSQINVALTLLHKWGAPIAKEFHFPESWNARKKRVSCITTNITLDQMVDEHFISKPKNVDLKTGYYHYKLTPWGIVNVERIYEAVLSDYDHKAYRAFLEVLERRVTDIVSRDYRSDYLAAEDHIRLRKRRFYIAAWYLMLTRTESLILWRVLAVKNWPSLRRAP